MILAVDVGNTETVLGLVEGSEPVACWRIATERRRTGDELALTVRGLLIGPPKLAAQRPEKPSRLVLCSVVPELDRSWEEAARILGLATVRIGAASPLPIRLEVDDPSGVGADRIANTMAAAGLYGRDTVVVDLGTATTFDCITAEGAFLGGVIAPGVRAGMERLAQATSQLPRVELAPPERVIGRRTVECLRSGVFYSVVDAIDGIVGRILREWEPEDPLVVATGGLAEVVAPHCGSVQRVEPFLTLRGLGLADRELGGEG